MVGNQVGRGAAVGLAVAETLWLAKENVLVGWSGLVCDETDDDENVDVGDARMSVLSVT